MHAQLAHEVLPVTDYKQVVERICNLNWTRMSEDDLVYVAWSYYHFSIQFRENLETARALYPDDALLQELDEGECNTDNLSPWPGVAAPQERMNHDEFMRRTLELAPLDELKRRRLTTIGQSYLATVRALDKKSRALAIASYEDGGLEAVFGAFLKAPSWKGPLLEAFKHFLDAHIAFDSDPDHGHGALCRHLTPDDRVLPFWTAFEHMLLETVPHLA